MAELITMILLYANVNQNGNNEPKKERKKKINLKPQKKFHQRPKKSSNIKIFSRLH